MYTTLNLAAISTTTNNFEVPSDNETPPSSDPPSTLISSAVTTLSSQSSVLSSTSISPLNFLPATPVHQDQAPHGRCAIQPIIGQTSSSLPSRGIALSTTTLGAVVGPPAPQTFPPSSNLPALSQNPTISSSPSLPEKFRKCSFVDALVDSGALIIETIWPNQTLSSSPSSTNSNARMLPLRVFIQETIRRSRTSFSTLQLALLYLLRLKPAVSKTFSFHPEWFGSSCSYGKNEKNLGTPLACGRRMFLASVIVASKYLQDRNYSNRAWSKISGLPVSEINANEFVFLRVVEYNLYVAESVYKRWSGVLLGNVMASVSLTGQVQHATSAVAQVAMGQLNVAGIEGVLTPPMSPISSAGGGQGNLNINVLKGALAIKFQETIRGLSADLRELDQRPDQQDVRCGGGVGIVFPTNPMFQLRRSDNVANDIAASTNIVTPPSSQTSDSEVMLLSPYSVPSVPSNRAPSPKCSVGRAYLKCLDTVRHCTRRYSGGGDPPPQVNLQPIQTSSPLRVAGTMGLCARIFSNKPVARNSVAVPSPPEEGNESISGASSIAEMPPTPRLEMDSELNMDIDDETAPSADECLLWAAKGLCDLGRQPRVNPEEMNVTDNPARKRRQSVASPFIATDKEEKRLRTVMEGIA